MRKYSHILAQSKFIFLHTLSLTLMCLLIRYVYAILTPSNYEQMKHIGSNMEFAQERLENLMRVYDNYITSCEYIKMPEVYKYIANAPADRFYVSDIRASIVVSDMLQGKPLPSMRPQKREMFEEISRRVVKLREQHPTWTLRKLCTVVVEQPAPRFYITPGSAKIFRVYALKMRSF